EIAFSDTGVGIPEKYRTKVFEPFYQVDPSTTRRFGGTGIGLALVKAHNEAQNGRVWVDDNEGEGSTFYIKLPLAKEKDL
ncbi:MAG TPA: ATP-binding protein, partial [Euryarchaeota archaeon]|nr:ATP-binding protein [Euryarchaeota archaeon]